MAPFVPPQIVQARSPQSSWLASLGPTANTGNYKLTYLNDGTANNTQDMVVFTSVPEPASLALLGLGMAGLGLARRKNQKIF